MMWRTELILMLALVLGVMITSPLRSAPVDLGTFGPTSDITPYLERLRAHQERTPSDSRRVRGNPIDGYQIRADRYPIVTTRMRPGRVVSRRWQAPGDFRPLCLVGNGAWSRDWARRHAGRLAAIGATCLMVQARNAPELERMRRILAGVPVIAASGNDLAQTLNLTHYPVLLTPEAMEQ
jgi:integrating conjugative element protein (TIGR03765 family)